MRITSDEHALALAALPFLGTAFGWWLSRHTAKSAAQEQRRIEGDRRLDDRRAALYVDMIMRADRAMREERQRLADGPAKAKPRDKTPAQDFEWRARASLFASSEVVDLWVDWVDSLAVLWRVVDKPGAQQNDAFASAVDRLADAREALVQQMRREFEAWHA